METLGIMTTVVLAAGVLVGAFVVVKSLPDVAQYRRLRKM